MAGNEHSGRKKIAPSEKRLTTGEVTAMTGFSGHYIRKCADMEGGIPHIRISGYRWFIKSDVLEWFEKRNINVPKKETA